MAGFTITCGHWPFYQNDYTNARNVPECNGVIARFFACGVIGGGQALPNESLNMNYARSFPFSTCRHNSVCTSVFVLCPQGLLVAYAAGDTGGGNQEMEDAEEGAAGRGCVVLIVVLSMGYLCALAVMLYYVATHGEWGEGAWGCRLGDPTRLGIYCCACVAEKGKEGGIG